MNSPKLFFLSILVATFASCAAPHVFIDTKLKPNTTEYLVEGRQNAFKRQMTVGKFAFTNIKRGWTTTGSKNIFFKKQNDAKSKISFKMKHQGMESETFCAAQARTKTLILAGIGLSDDTKDVYTGMIQMKDSASWDFTVKNANNINWSDPAGGFATNGKKRIEIKDVRKAEGKTPKLMPDTIFGYTFNLDNEPIAVVETIAGKGGVWIKKGLDAETEFVVANLAAAMLLRPDLSSVERL
jgi:hypothetical protein